MDLNLKNKRALVMGSSRGLGNACALSLAQEGVNVILTGRTEDALAASCKEIISSGGSAEYRVVDFGNVLRISQDLADLGDVDIVVTNCGGPPAGPVAGLTDESIEKCFESMVRVPLAVVGMFLPGMRERKFGRIINIASSGVIQPIANLGLSNMLRPALVGWAKTMASEVASDGVTVNTVVPGRIHTQRVDQLDMAAAARQGKSVDEVSAASRARIPMQRYGEPSEFADMVTFLSSPKAGYVTGSLVRVDGGLIASV
ncbi:SDR family oxidoreductase [Acetobacter conturbans]|uniref:SDR family oxidoreductase n=1 Tax=Acetobacter conturbans TaxID=1737472 RepID=A0ABX0K8R7_9PROT|nr:SDR family oxidoreductase [Acetobacter conturbans]NHN89784.1 SDR family oxidoreductase [Acetobacter conturbans]